jgi:hypothetical protein
MSILKSINPVNGSLVGTYPEHSSKEINNIIYEVNNSFNFFIQSNSLYFMSLEYECLIIRI